MAEEEHKEEHKEEKKEGGGIGDSFQKHKTLWIVGGVGAAGVLLLLFMNSGGSQQQQAAPNTQDLSTVGQGGAVDTSSLVGTGGMPSWYNPGAAENLDYWPYVSHPSQNGGDKSGSSGGGSTKSSGGGTKSSGGGTKSSGGGTKSSGGGSKSSGGSKSGSGGTKSGGGVTHGTSHGAGKTTKPSTKGTAHGHIITVGKDTNIAALQTKYFPGSNGSNAQGNIKQYGNNAKLLKGHISKTGVVKAGTRLVV